MFNDHEYQTFCWALPFPLRMRGLRFVVSCHWVVLGEADAYLQVFNPDDVSFIHKLFQWAITNFVIINLINDLFYKLIKLAKHIKWNVKF